MISGRIIVTFTLGGICTGVCQGITAQGGWIGDFCDEECDGAGVGSTSIGTGTCTGAEASNRGAS